MSNNSRSSAGQSEQGEEGYVISVAAELAGMHAQTLRTYDRMGLVTPARTRGGGRRYSQDDVDTLRTIQRLSQDKGVNLAGIKNAQLRRENERLSAQRGRPRGELVHVPRSTSIVVWENRRGRSC